MEYEPFYFVDHRGRNPVKEFLSSLPKREQAKFFAYLAELTVAGQNLRRPMADYLGNGIYELRPNKNRIFYFFYFKNKIVLLHGIRKKTNKIPKAGILICHRRKVIVELNHKMEKIE